MVLPEMDYYGGYNMKCGMCSLRYKRYMCGTKGPRGLFLVNWLKRRLKVGRAGVEWEL
jgi:hypothetical protein